MRRCLMCKIPLVAEVSDGGYRLTWRCPKHGHVAGEIRGFPKIGFLEKLKIKLFGYQLVTVDNGERRKVT